MLAACLCFKDSAPYLREWLLFHFVQGFRKFYLYNNESSDEWRTVVGAWVKIGLVEAFDFPGLAVQHAIYNDCIERSRGRVDWLALIDDDEFLFPSRGGCLSGILSSYGEAAGVAIPWVLFGSGGEERFCDGWVIERFTKSAGVPDQHVKCVVRPERVKECRLIGHAVEPFPGLVVVDELKNPVSEALIANPSVERLRINHYLVKSWEEWKIRRQRPQANTGKPTPLPESDWRNWDMSWSRRCDDSARIFAPSMRKAAMALNV